jgi:hypothetical protein
MAQRIVQIAAGGRLYTGRPILGATAMAVAVQVAEAIRAGGSAPGRLLTLGETDGFEHTVLRVSAISGVELVDPDSGPLALLAAQLAPQPIALEPVEEPS